MTKLYTDRLVLSMEVAERNNQDITHLLAPDKFKQNVALLNYHIKEKILDRFLVSDLSKNDLRVLELITRSPKNCLPKYLIQTEESALLALYLSEYGKPLSPSNLYRSVRALSQNQLLVKVKGEGKSAKGLYAFSGLFLFLVGFEPESLFK